MILFVYDNNEGILILENISEMGALIPGFLKKIFEKLDKREKDEPD